MALLQNTLFRKSPTTPGVLLQDAHRDNVFKEKDGPDLLSFNRTE